ncbi:MAG: gliding motility-associated C-terminal domain-containing protein [Cyclobacteriaceae bacterium]
MKKLIVYIIAILSVCFAQAFHIVGGEIEFLTLEPGRYRVTLIQYKDEAQTENPFYDPDLVVAIYSNKDDSQVGSFFLPRLDILEVAYSNEECALEELQTSKIIYSAEFELNPQDYADEEGYYLVYERCCRNAVIKNIVNPDNAGMKYVLEIPPLWKDGKPFINSSPSLLRPLSDYACIDQLYYTNFTGVDPDGDSLVYRMVVPLNSHLVGQGNGFVPPSPKPHVNIAWSGDYGLDNIVPGSPPLNISNRGLLTVSPFETGIYVFSVMVEEWRDQVKIGEVQRDFQMLVVDGCNPPDPPDVGIKIPNDDSFNPLVDTLNYALTDDKCFDFIITNITPGETINLRADPVNFSEEIHGIFSITQAFIQSGQDTLIVEVCAPGCPPVRDGPFIIDLIAADDACPLPQLDTARLIINVEPPPNDLPVIGNTVPGITLNEGEEGIIGFSATDVDLDSMVIDLVVPGVLDPSEKGVTLDITRNQKGLIEGNIEWQADCQKYDFSDSPNFIVGIKVDDLDTCMVENDDIRWINMSVILPLNSSPQITANINSMLTLGDGETLSVDVQVNDADNDTVQLNLLNKSQFEDLGLTFQDTLGVGTVSSPLSWTIDCDIIAKTDQRVFEMLFVAEDFDTCDETNLDTLSLVVNVEFDPNLPPQFDVLPDTVIEINTPFEYSFSSTDPNSSDLVTIEWFNEARLPRSPSLLLESESGQGQANATLYWTPECSLLDFGETSKQIDLIFISYDDGCPNIRLDTTRLVVEIRETRELFEGFDPPNVFTPNNDGANDFFTLTNLSEPQMNLPPDNCDDAFLFITIHDRSGSKVYESTDRAFRWSGENYPSGVYYYQIKYERTTYNGYLHLLK